ncbi:MAG: DEAD/DEAH box helicase [Gammaproteobacteria bacterium]|nr:DEAD/DEAH box helicase [Gammaproteobacteria bacterium]
MIPSTVATDVSDALADFLATAFGPSNDRLGAVMDDFLNVEGNLTRGPHLSVDLPFQPAPEGGEPFPASPLGFVPYRHQRTAFNRLAAGESTVVATGTGSGKTECFLYPVVDHCRRQIGNPGVKAILIYPMNALASDQSRRIAELIDRTAALRGKVTAGLYVGGTGASSREEMAADHLIENRDVLRERPPDILLTNYKMLDLLLTRPVDAPLWRHNVPGTLRYLVVDELHTFDGAQGTDLACLIRRLRARLQADEQLVCVGTSATLGGKDDHDSIRRYASTVFHQRFAPDSIIGEVRQGIDEFLRDAIISSHLTPQPDLDQRLDPKGYQSVGDYLSAQHAVFFGEPPRGEIESVECRLEVGRGLREHASFVNLLRVLDESRPTPLATVLERLQRSLPVSSPREAMNLLNALCALISFAREKQGDGPDAPIQPFLNVKVHVWIRELRRMVCSVQEEAHPNGAAANGNDTGEDAETTLDRTAVTGTAEALGHDARTTSHPLRRLRYSDDLGVDEGSIHLPLVQCRECHTTGWGCVKLAAESRVEQDLRVFYNRFFLRDIDVSYLFPLGPSEPPPQNMAGTEHKLCGACGYLAAPSDDACPGCGQSRLVRVFRPNAVARRRRGEHAYRELSRDCPYCGARDALIILGARASSLLSTALAQLYASRHNDDHKVIAFSDNVQDAAHRGSFFAARTWRNSVRAAVAQVVASNDGIALDRLPDKVMSRWGDLNLNPAAFDEKRFISEFIAPDRLWLRDFEHLREHGALPAGSDLLSLVQRRLRWDSLAEVTFGAAIGRTLERTRTVAVGFDEVVLEQACEQTAVRLREEFGELRAMGDDHARQLVLGILRRMKDRGAIRSVLFYGYLRNGGNPYAIRDIALQEFGPRSALPVFPSSAGDYGGVEPLVGRQRKSWYQMWTEKVLTPVHVLAATRDAGDVLRLVMDVLVATGLAETLPARRAPVWALDPEQLYVTTDTAVVGAQGSQRSLVVPAKEALSWQGVPCLDFGAHDYYAEPTPGEPTWAGRLYLDSEIRRIVSAEHTALVPREERDRLQERFAADDPKPWEPNLLSATPTLELGVDIGELSTVVMCSVPPAPVNYVQRTGRAGRRDGNALALTVATGQPHDLYYYADPLEMLGSRIDPPGIFLNAPAVLERQLTAFCMDCWVASGVDAEAVPRTIRPVLDNVEKGSVQGFPHPWFDFIAENADDLLHRFFAAFEPRSEADDGLDDSSMGYLTTFVHGADSESSLRLRVLNRLKEVADDRQSLRNDVEALGRRIRTLRRGPTDEHSRDEIRELGAERTAMQRLLRDINQRETFGFFTDEGLLPNYAFPEQGVTLNSVIYRRRQTEGGETEDDAVVYDYVRPAVAALGEFAPENEFYAGGRRVTIQRIDTRVSPIERWRLCRACSYCENIDAGDHHSVCPRCGDAMWGDAGQVRDMLRLRLVHAATPDRYSRIMDERDDREPLFYTRQLVADFDPTSVARAFASENPDRPFGFEYVPSATFREMNFGRLDEQSSVTTFAGETMPRKGFSICRRCGGVQSQDGVVEHTKTCSADDGRDIVDCLYLYREFKSEAVRMLIPQAGSMDTERHLSSFIAALELGLRRQFAGAVDHLRVMTCQFPSAESGADLTFLMLYDTVPGGTGYLKQMMNDPENVLGILRLAKDALQSCECNADPGKDGCYRCVYAYRRSYDMASTSRDTALAILRAILEEAEALREVQGLRSVKVNPFLESELEARFVEALRRIELDGKAVRVREDIVGGKPGFVLTTADLTYYMEVQPEFGESAGVSVASRPDFVIRPARESAVQPPIAIFMDGFEFHRERTDDDSVKRMALVRAGYLVWSLTWHDLEVALGKNDDAADLLGDAAQMAGLQRSLDSRWGTGLVRSRLREPSLLLLVRYLQNPDAQAWQRAVFTELFCPFDHGSMTSPAMREAFLDAAAQLTPAFRDALVDLPTSCAFAGRGEWRDTPPSFTQIFVALPLAAVETPEPGEMVVALHLDDDRQSSEADYRREWNGVLRLFNLLQFLPNAWWTTALGVKRDVYPEFIPPEPEPETTDLGEWAEAVELAANMLRPAMVELASLDVAPPEVGFELMDAEEQVGAEAELAWGDERVAVLLPESDGSPFIEAGWHVVQANDPELVAGIAAFLKESEL